MSTRGRGGAGRGRARRDFSDDTNANPTRPRGTETFTYRQHAPETQPGSRQSHQSGSRQSPQPGSRKSPQLSSRQSPKLSARRSPQPPRHGWQNVSVGSGPVARPAGMSSSDSSDDDGFNFGSSTRKSKNRPKTAPSKNKAATHGAAGAYFFSRTIPDPSDMRSSVSTAVSSRWGADAPRGGRSSGPSAKSAPNKEFPNIPGLRENIVRTMNEINACWNNGFPVNRDHCLAYVSVAVRQEYQDCPNPYAAGLYFMCNSSDFFASKSLTISVQVILELKKWLLDRGLSDLEKTCLTSDLQLIAFDLVTRQTNAPIIKTVCEVYRLDQVRNSLVEPIRELCADARYKEACNLATYLRMHTHFDVHDFVVPLLLQDREYVAEEFLAGSKEKQMDLVSFLDSMLDERRNCNQTFRDYIEDRKIPTPKLEKLHSKPLMKMVTRLTEKFKADPTICPNFNRKKRSAALRHLVFRKYEEGVALNDDCFEELVDSTVQGDPTLQDEIVSLIRINADLNMAARFALRHAIPLERVPSDVQKTMHSINPGVVPLLPEPPVLDDEDWELELNPNQPRAGPSASAPIQNTNVSPLPHTAQQFDWTENRPLSAETTKRPPNTEYYSSSIPKENIHFIDEPFGVESFLTHVKAAFAAQKNNGGRKDFIIVSLDSEWRPIDFEKGKGVALIQIGIADEVFLIDTGKLKSTSCQSQPFKIDCWTNLRTQFFADETVVKLGFALSGDVKKFCDTCPQWQTLKADFKSSLDLVTVCKELLRRNENFFPHVKLDGSTGPTSLSELVRCTFGKPLSKEEQFSDWERRPLRDAQIQYAAMDAYVLLEIFAFMNKRSQELNIDLDGIVRTLLKSGVPPVPRRKPTTSEVVHSAAKSARKVPVDSPYKSTRQLAGDMKFICDNMVQGLGKVLRSCGIDTLILDSNEDHEKCVRIAFEGGRVVLTRGSTYGVLSSQFPEIQFFNVTVDDVHSQLEAVLSYFNIDICEADIFSRCQKCNSGTFVSVGQRTMEFYMYHRNRALGLPNHGPFPVRDDILLGEITYAVDQGQIVKKWNLLPENTIDASNYSDIRTSGGSQILFDKISFGHLEKIDTFIVCDRCGQIYWDGGHYKRVKEGRSVIPAPSADRKASSTGHNRSAKSPSPNRRSSGTGTSGRTSNSGFRGHNLNESPNRRRSSPNASSSPFHRQPFPQPKQK